LRGDIVSGISVCVVMIPSVLAYAELAGVRPQAGLYARFGAMVLYALFTSTRRIIVGPDTTIALLVGSVVIPLAADDPARAADLAALLALMTGALLIVAGRVGFGDVADLLSTPVLIGYAAGAALLSSAPSCPCCSASRCERRFLPARRRGRAAQSRRQRRDDVLGIGLIALILLVNACAARAARARRVHRGDRRVARARLAVARRRAPVADVLDAADAGLPAITLRDVQALAPGALALALARVRRRHPHGAHARREAARDGRRRSRARGARRGQRLGRLVSGFTVGASTSRSLTADATGAQTQLAQWVAAVVLVLFVLFVAPAGRAAAAGGAGRHSHRRGSAPHRHGGVANAAAPRPALPSVLLGRRARRARASAYCRAC
jgi:SulP family sulfate permease